MDERILDKIKKLLALAKSTSNEHEAANAMRKVQALMREHQLTDTDVALHEVSEKACKCINQGEKQPNWSTVLSHTISKAFGISHIYSWDSRPVRRTVIFFGMADRVEIGTYCYEVLAPQLLKARKAYLATLNKRLKTASKTNRADLFAEGWISTVYHKIERLVPTEQEQGLVKLYQDKRFTNRTGLKTRETKENKRDMGSYYEGAAQGKHVRLNAGVAGAAQGRLNHK